MRVTDDSPVAYLSVLASGSAGNCSVLEYGQGSCRRACLIDLGLPPRRTINLLDLLGIGLHQIDDVLVTHLDSDHFHPGWMRWLPGHVRVRMHLDHARRAWSDDADGLPPPPGELLAPFEAPFTLQSGIEVRPLRLAHDQLGVTAFRLDLPAACGGGTLGFATDLGRVTRGLIDLFRYDGSGEGPDVLAIESNYCPRLQDASDRPAFLKHRIMGGRGHLSNEEALDAIGRIRPREHVVLLHLSRECNDPARVAELHAGADYALTIAEQERPTRRVRIGGTPRTVVRRMTTPSLFEPMAS